MIRSRGRCIAVVVCATTIAACSRAQVPLVAADRPHTDLVDAEPHAAAPQRVILVIADGAGVNHWTLAAAEFGPLAVRRMPVAGLIDTRSTSPRVSDSAAGATALATGVRTFNGAIGVGPDSQAVRTLLEVAEARGWATGLVTTTDITDATPAAFAAHVPSRRMQAEIARQMAAQEIEVLLGGGRDWFDGTAPGSADLRSAVRGRGTYLTSPDELRRLDASSTSSLVGLFTGRSPRAAVAANDRPTLSDMARAALAVLHRHGNFFLMVETEVTDEAAHANAPIDELTAAMRELDRAVDAVLEYQARHPGTLVVVTADHETGGVIVERDSTGTTLRYATRGHTQSLVPLFAGGPGAEMLGGLKDNAEVGRILLALVDGSATARPH